MKKQILFCLLCLFVSGSVAAQSNYQKVCDTIPYRMIHSKIVIPVTVGDTIVHFILDTGGQTGIQYKYFDKLNAKYSGTNRPVGDYSGKGMAYREGKLLNVMFGKRYKIEAIGTLIFPNNKFFDTVGVVGLLGSDAFAQTVLTIDSKLGVIVVNYPYRPGGLKIEDGVEMVKSTKDHPYVTTNIASNRVNVLFDTGAQGLLMLSTNDYQNFKNKEGVKVVNTAFGIGGVGIGGLGKPQNIEQLSVSEINFMGLRLKNARTEMFRPGSTIIGVDVIQYGRVIIDYMRGRFYYMPYGDTVVDVENPKMWNVNILPDKDGFFISAVWSQMKDVVQFGERVINLNGQELAKIEKSQMVIDDMLNAIEGNSAYIIVRGDDEKEKKITIQKI